MTISLDDKYLAESGRVYLTGTQALVRLPMTQMRRDRAAGLNTGAYISGYRGSPLGGFDQQLVKAKRLLDRHDILFQPGLNEDLAATAVWGSQQLHLSTGARKDGLLGMWYAKGPGVDRSGDVLKHANAAGSSAQGGVLALAGDDHTCKSSSIPHQSDHTFISALMPMLYPSSVHEFLEMGLLGIAMSRYSGCWVGYKVISETVETTSVVDLAAEARQFVLPTDFEMPEGGLNLRWPDPALVQDERLQEHKGFAAIAFARANQVDQVTLANDQARLGIVASGKAYEDVLQALIELGIGQDEARLIGLRLYKVRMPWPLEPEGIRRFSQGLDEVLVVEERREIIENQIKQQLFNWRSDVRPRIIGKHDEADRPLLHLSAGLSTGDIAQVIAARILKFPLPEGLAAHLHARAQALTEAETRGTRHGAPVTRLPHFCAGCPHNTSTRVPEGSKAMAGIGCHYMAQWMDRNTETFTHMGGEGVPWAAISHFTDEKHRFANLGDGTYFHSGHLAIRQSVAARANITYKILYNDAVAMTGGQPIDGSLTPQQICHQVHHEGVARIILMSDRPDVYAMSELPAGCEVRHRDLLDQTMAELRAILGVTVIVYEQTCAAELRRRRKRGTAPDPDQRVWINPAVCEGCGDCSVQSNCIAVEPLETEHGRKRKINQSSCNKDFSCLKGFCPSFVTLRGAKLHRPKGQVMAATNLPEPQIPQFDRPWNLAVTGVGGTGVLTIGALISMAAHIEGRVPMVLDMAGLAQKGGAVLSHLRLSGPADPPTAPRITAGRADLLLGADSVVSASKDAIILCDPDRTDAVLNTHLTPVSDFVRLRDFDFRTESVEAGVANVLRNRDHFHNFSSLAMGLMGDEIGSNIMMLGYAWQKGLIPLQRASITGAIELNAVAVASNLAAFEWGRQLAEDPVAVMALATPRPAMPVLKDLSLDQLLEARAAHLRAYQDAALAQLYLDRIAALRAQTDDEVLLRSAAQGYARVLASKDEYEVARLYSEPSFTKAMAAEFDGAYRLSFNFAPPFLSGKTADGRPKKREFGAWILPMLSALAKLRWLRGSWADPFRHTKDRKLERELRGLFETDLELIRQQIGAATDQTRAKYREILALYEQVRGFGPVKEAAFDRLKQQRAALHAGLSGPEPMRFAAE